GRARPVSFEVANGCRIQPRLLPGRLDGTQLSVNSGTHDTHPCPITGYPHAFDDRINTLPLGAGILQPAQYDYAAPFADQEPIGPSVERPDLLAARQRTQLGEYT